jgi:signal transduction histidine kinase
VTNAIKYGGGDRKILISATTGRTSHRHTEIRISVEDHGMGISRQDLSRIFQPFFRSPSVVAAQIRGTGLGLAVAQSVAEGMGARLSVVSNVGKGSTFTLHLPVAQRASSSTSAQNLAGTAVTHNE